MSFYLSRLLGLDNIPPVVLSWVSPDAPQWTGINYTSLQWQDDQIVALIDWVPDINLQGWVQFLIALLLQGMWNLRYWLCCLGDRADGAQISVQKWKSLFIPIMELGTVGPSSKNLRDQFQYIFLHMYMFITFREIGMGTFFNICTKSSLYMREIYLHSRDFF